MIIKKKRMPKVTGAKKHAILTEQQRKNLNSLSITNDSLQKLHRQLNKIFPELHEDLKIIKKSKHLKTWISYHSRYDYEWKHRGEILSKMFSESEQLYVECIISFVGKDRKRYFWIDLSGVNKKSRINQRALKKDYIFHKLRYDFKNDKSVLEKAFDLNIIPFEKKNAIPLKQLKMEVDEGKYKTESTVKEPKIKKQIETELTKLWKEIGPEWDSITKKAKKRGINIPRKLPESTIIKIKN